MADYTIEQRVQMITFHYQNDCSCLQTLRALRIFNGRQGGPSQLNFLRFVAEFKYVKNCLKTKNSKFNSFNTIKYQKINCILRRNVILTLFMGEFVPHV